MGFVNITEHSPGGKVLRRMPAGVVGNAYISEDKKHRIWLSRYWGPEHRYALVIGLNPSTARHDMDDPTISRVTSFAQALGYDGFFMMNLSSYRATKPQVLIDVLRANEDDRDPLVHPDQWHCMWKTAMRCSVVIMACGEPRRELKYLLDRALFEIEQANKRPQCLGTTKYGYPRHPLYVKGTTRLQSWGRPTKR